MAVVLLQFCILLMPRSQTLAQNNRHFIHLTQQDGLSNDFILSFLQDHQGFIWIGTENGLNRCDGYQFTVFKDELEDPGSLQGSFIWSIFEDSRHTLWVGTDRGLNRLDRETGKFDLIKLSTDPDASKNPRVMSICEDGQQNLWVGTTNDGLKRLSRNGKSSKLEIRHFHNEPDNPNSISSNRVVQLLAGENGYLWIGTDRGIDRLHLHSGQIERFQPHPSIPTSAEYDHITGLVQDRNGKIIFSTSRAGICRIDQPDSTPLTKDFSSFFYDLQDPASISNKTIRAISPAGQNRFWVGTHQGLYDLDLATGAATAYVYDPQHSGSLSFDRINALLKDDHGHLWVGTYGSGVN